MKTAEICDEARKCAVAWGEAKGFDMIDTMKLGEDIQRVVNSGKAEGFESRQGEWISVADRLPETKIDGCATANVLAIVEGMTGIQVMCYGGVDGEDVDGNDAFVFVWSNCYGDIRGDGEWDDNYNVTHWQPLPEPPPTATNS